MVFILQPGALHALRAQIPQRFAVRRGRFYPDIGYADREYNELTEQVLSRIAHRNESPHGVIASEAWQSLYQRHLGTRDCHASLAMTRKTVCQSWIVPFVCLRHCRRITHAANRYWAVSDAGYSSSGRHNLNSWPSSSSSIVQHRDMRSISIKRNCSKASRSSYQPLLRAD